jgi:lipopolysaccharide transport protein LptA
MTWQKKARLAIAVFVVGFVTMVVITLRRPKPVVVEPPAPVQTAGNPIVETKGRLVYDHFKDGKIVFSVRADDGQLVFADGRTVYRKATLNLPERNGRAVSVHADEAEILGKTGAAVGKANLKGNVRLTTSDGVDVRADEAVYSDDEGKLTIPGPVEFARGRLKGKGNGATYETDREILWLLEQAHITVAPDARGEGAMDATAGAAGLARAEHYARLVRSARIVASGRIIEADDITIRLTGDDERVRVLELRANSRITGGAQAMSARDIDLTYGADGRALESARLVDNAVVQLPAAGGNPGRRIAARTIDLGLSPDGQTVTSLSASENVQVDLPAEGETAARRIRSATLTAAGAPDSGLQNATFAGDVDYRETRAATAKLAAVNRVARASRLVVETAPGLGAIQQADFRGDVHITDGPSIVAQATRVLYRVADDRMDLSPGEAGDKGPESQVTDGRITVRARTIELTPGTRRMKAETQVRSTFQPKPAQARPASSDPVTQPAQAAGTTGDPRMPSMLAQDKPVNVTANRLDYQGALGLATYSGNARLWQDGTTIKAATLILDDTKGNLRGELEVTTLMMISEVDPKTKVRRETETIGRAQTFVYDDAKRLATYTTKANINGAQGDLRADTIELYLAAQSNELERAEADGAVTVKEAGRTATGTHLIYTAANDTYEMTGTVGTPVIVIEEKDGQCTRTQGTRLRFTRAVEGIRMDDMQSRPCTPGTAR